MNKIFLTLSILFFPVASNELWAQNDPLRDDFSAGWIGADLTNDLLPNDSITKVMEENVALIKSKYSFVAEINNRIPWVPGYISLTLDTNGWPNYKMGNHRQLDSLNNFYGVDSILESESRSGNVGYLGIFFKLDYNSHLLTKIYSGLDGVRESLVWHTYDGNDITYENGIYKFKNGWMDCPAGCIYRHFWEFEINAGEPQLIKEYGDPICQPLCEASAIMPVFGANENRKSINLKYFDNNIFLIYSNKNTTNKKFYEANGQFR